MKGSRARKWQCKDPVLVIHYVLNFYHTVVSLNHDHSECKWEVVFVEGQSLLSRILYHLVSKVSSQRGSLWIEGSWVRGNTVCHMVHNVKTGLIPWYTVLTETLYVIWYTMWKLVLFHDTQCSQKHCMSYGTQCENWSYSMIHSAHRRKSLFCLMLLYLQIKLVGVCSLGGLAMQLPVFRNISYVGHIREHFLCRSH